MQYDVHPFLSGHPELQDTIQKFKQENNHFANLLQKYEDLALEIGKADSNVPGYHIEDLELDQIKKERLVVKDELMAFLKENGVEI